MNSSARCLALIVAFTTVVVSVPLKAMDRLPVFLSDNHAETYGWIARTVDPDSPHTLVLVDAHPDSTCVEHSDELRDGLRQVVNERERDERIENWRKSGRIDAFSWIEPLLPLPLNRVVWVAGHRFDADRKAVLLGEARDSIDGRLGFELRSSGSFAKRWKTMDANDLKKWKPGDSKVILAIDLDYFADMNQARREREFEDLWETALTWPGLTGVAVAVSRPWQHDDRHADELVLMALDAVNRTRGARVELDLSMDDRPDHSLKGDRLNKQGKAVPRWDAEISSAGLKALLLSTRNEWRVYDRARDWSRILTHWADDLPEVALICDNGSQSVDGVWRFPVRNVPVLRMHAPVGMAATGRVRWHLLTAAQSAYDLIPGSGLGKGFSKHPGRWIYQKKTSLGETSDFALSPEAWGSVRCGCGRYIIGADYETDHGWLPCREIELRLTEGEGFRAGLSECFQMPYAFGIALAEDHGSFGVDTGWGSDCSNYLVHAWRRSGHPLTWGDPGLVRNQLLCIAKDVTKDTRVPITLEQIRKGVAVDFGGHMAALWEDRPPLGVLDGNDLMVHHLGGLPEVIELRNLATVRPAFKVLVPQGSRICRMAVSGDMVLADVTEEDMTAILTLFRGTDLVLANLEGVPSTHAGDKAGKYDFHFPPERLAWLGNAGVHVVSLANNHAADGGRANISAAVDVIRASGLGVVGVGADALTAAQPWRGERNEVKLAVFGACLVDAPIAGKDGWGVLHLPEHADALQVAMAECKQRGELIVVMIHWGDEYSQAVNEEQRQWARWLTERGASVVAGSHPHVIQGLDWHAGGVVDFSLGNAVYPRNLGNLGRGAVLRVALDESCGIGECSTVPILVK